MRVWAVSTFSLYFSKIRLGRSARQWLAAIRDDLSQVHNKNLNKLAAIIGRRVLRFYAGNLLLA
jgi:hypothetical protein